jgi:maltooligosyltrehalose trehalohydrolase
MFPDPQAPETFLASKLNWSEVEDEPHSTLLGWYADLIRIRREYPSLSDGRLDRVKVRFDEEAGWMLIRRGSVSVAINLAEETRRVPLSRSGANMLLRSDFLIEVCDDTIELPPDSVAVLAL